MIDVVIIGAGVTGSFIAKELSKFDLKVTVLEKKLAPGLEQTKACSGVIHPFQLPFKLFRSKLCIEGNKLMDEEVKELGFKFRRVGLIAVATNFLTFLAIPFIILYLRIHGIEAKMIGKKKLLKMEPNLAKSVYGGILIPSAGVVNPVEMTAKACRFARLNGVDFRYGCEVIGIDVKKESFIVKTTMGEFETKSIVNCAGIYADEISRMVGYEIKIIPGKGTHIVFGERNFTNHLVVPIPFKLHKRTKGGGALVSIDGKAIWGPNLIDVDEKDDTSVKKEELDGIIAKFAPLFKRIPEEIIAVYAGLRSVAGSDFIINEPLKRFINVAGIQSPGLTAAPAIAKYVVKMLSEHFELKKKEIFKPKFEKQDFDEIVCLCNMVTRKEIEEVVAEWQCVSAVKHLTWAGMDCEKCLAEIIKIIGSRVPKEEVGGEIAWL
ncbi:MAG: FAD-dependent oxidoreductase [Archaeoglobaceae archaeon]